jgi:zinc transport system substrate-binding protein
MQHKRRSVFLGPLGGVVGILVFCMPVYAAVPRVLVSINPFYGLVAGVMQGIAKPSLLLDIGASPHDYSLKPSQMRQLQDANLIFWGGPDLESFLIKPLKSQKAKTLAFEQVPGLERLAMRSQDHVHHGHDEQHSHGLIDMHFWLDPHNAIAMTKAIILHLSVIDPEHQKQYQSNGNVLIGRLKTLDLQLQKNLAAVQSKPYVVFHDAYQYFEKRYHLQGAGSLSLHPELPPSAKRLSRIRAMIEQEKVVCLFSEPQFSPALVRSIASELQIKTGVLDPLGTDPSAEGYFSLMATLSEALKGCLEDS